jgi:acyl-CoA synthetase (NDP forming)
MPIKGEKDASDRNQPKQHIQQMTTPRNIILNALKEGRKALFENEAKELARSAGIIVPRFVLSDPEDQKAIVTAGESLGFPIVLKAISAEILHKTDVGAVILNITTSAGLTASISTMKNMISARAPSAVIRSFMIEKMMPQGLEVLIGGLRDRQFGPSLSFGLGGVWVEALRDAVFGILPMTRNEMLEMIGETRAGTFLRGFRGSPPLDQEAVIGIFNAIANLLTEHPEIREIDMNPVRVYARSAAALDVRIILA